jgi:hypothetical protein
VSTDSTGQPFRWNRRTRRLMSSNWAFLQFRDLPEGFGAKVPDLEPEPQLNAPLDPETLKDTLKRMQ